MPFGSTQEAIRKVLKEKVPPYYKDGLIRDVCEDIIQAFGALYPDRALNLCMSIAQKLSTSASDRNIHPPRRRGRKGTKARRRKPVARPRR